MSSVPGLTPELLARAQAEGMVRVIVTLRVPAGATDAAIEVVKQTVLAEIAPTRHRVVHALPNFPQLVLDASDDTLRALGASPNVLRIEEPILDRPLR
jgi:hypothetical protein